MLRILTDGTNEQVKNNNMEDHNTQVELTENDQKVFLPLRILEVPSTHPCWETVYR